MTVLVFSVCLSLLTEIRLIGKVPYYNELFKAQW